MLFYQLYTSHLLLLTCKLWTLLCLVQIMLNKRFWINFYHSFMGFPYAFLLIFCYFFCWKFIVSQRNIAENLVMCLATFVFEKVYFNKTEFRGGKWSSATHIQYKHSNQTRWQLWFQDSLKDWWLWHSTWKKEGIPSMSEVGRAPEDSLTGIFKQFYKCGYCYAAIEQYNFYMTTAFELFKQFSVKSC